MGYIYNIERNPKNLMKMKYFFTLKHFFLTPKRLDKAISHYRLLDYVNLDCCFILRRYY
jgi:hypothetical protein